MADREKVLTWLEICGKNNECSGCCPYSENGFGEYGQCRESLMADAYDLLKEQEEQEQRWLQNIADNQIVNAPKDSPMSLDEQLESEYKSGIYDGLQMAFEILTEGR